MPKTTKQTRRAAGSRPRRKTRSAKARVKPVNASAPARNGGRSSPVRGVNGEAHAVFFVLWKPDARKVSVIGDFNGWDPAVLPLKRDGDGCWAAEAHLPPGRHEYLLVVDGIRCPDRETQSVANAAGGIHSVITVPPDDAQLCRPSL